MYSKNEIMQNRRRSIDQLKKIDQMFGGRRESEIIKVTEVESDKKCNVHRRGSRANSIEPSHFVAVNKNLDLDKNRKMYSSAINISNSWNDTIRRSSMSTMSLGKDAVDSASAAAIRRRQSFTEGSGVGRNTATLDRNRNNMLVENSKNFCNCNKSAIHSKSMEDIRALPTANHNHNHINHNSNNNSTKLKPRIPASGSNDESNYSSSVNNKFGGGVNLNNWKYKRHSMDNLFDGEIKALESTFQNDGTRPQFVAVTTLEDVQAVRCAEFHPSGRVYAVGSNSKTFRICEYPSLSEVREEHTTYQPTVLFKRTKHHKGSIYCIGWSPDGELVATGSNDKTIKLMRYDDVKKQLEGREIELTMHDSTVRDLCFLEDASNKASLLISGGAGDCKIYVTDCATATPFQALSGHGGHILSLYNWGGAMFVSGSQDKTIRFWDLRTRGCVNTITPATSPGTRQGSPVAAVSVDPSGRLLVSGHEDSSCVLYDIRGNRPIQCFKPHSSDIRSIRFSPSAYYLLTAGYDNKLVLTDLQGDLTLPLPSVVVAHHADKAISGRWHPTDFSFLSTSADKTATLWALPPL